MIFSIKNPEYQRAADLRLSIESLIHTVHFSSEAIIIDDNSPKETQNYLKHLSH